MEARGRIVVWDTTQSETSPWQQHIQVIPGRIVSGTSLFVDLDLVLNERTLHRALYPSHGYPPGEYDVLHGLIIYGDDLPEFDDPHIKTISVRIGGDFEDAIRHIMIGRGSG
jgi:hypothetical protein